MDGESIDTEPGGFPPRRPLPPGDASRVAKAIVCAVLRVASTGIESPRRENAVVARARHVAMYLAHTSLSLTLAETGAAFGRDRTSVAYAMRRIEDARDAPAFDAMLLDMEDLARTIGQVVTDGR